jgi:hypothetical protein
VNGALTIVRPPGLAPARALCHGCAMIKPDARAGGCFLSLLIIAGFIAGLSFGDPVAGALIGTAAGIVVAALVWLADRKGRR